MNEGKLRIDLIPPSAIEGIARVLQKGAEKYAERNWEAGMPWSKTIASFKRHLLAFEKGQDYDEETGLLHIDHILCNAVFLKEYYKTFPQGDDRQHYYLNHNRIGLDIDGVLADFDGGIKGKYGVKSPANHWYYSYIFETIWDELCKDKDYWTGLSPLIDGGAIPFDPVCYVTSRDIPTEWTKEWLEKNNFPCVPVYTVPYGASKVEALKDKVDIFVDDRWENFVELNKAGICCYLFDQPWNRKHDVGHKRIKSLKELV